MITAVIPHWYDARDLSLREGVEALQWSTTPPARILIWDNTNTLEAWSGVEVIRSSTNVGPCGRFLAALLATTDWVWFQDNDVVVQPETLANAVRVANAAPHRTAIYSLEGRIRAIHTPYRHWPKVYGRGLGVEVPPMPVTISLGRAELVPTFRVRDLVGMLPWHDEDLAMDDIWWSYVADQCGLQRLVIPTVAGRSDITERKTPGTGACHQPGFYDRRDTLVRALFD
jgi:hypothetical protein